MSNLSYNAKWIIGWINRMSETHGSIVTDLLGNTYDWGQALCRECYGEDWENIQVSNPPDNDLLRAQDWEDGLWPEWCKKTSV
jgi:hypothetical protein